MTPTNDGGKMSQSGLIGARSERTGAKMSATITRQEAKGSETMKSNPYRMNLLALRANGVFLQPR